MNFPQTRLTLIRRIASSGSEEDWRQFLLDYWGPLCRFAAQQGKLSSHEAEDVASQVCEVLVYSQLFERWHDNRTAKLRTLLCSVVRNVLSNRRRVAQGRQRILQELARQGAWSAERGEPEAAAGDIDAFYRAWILELVQQSVEQVMADCHAEGKGDYFRVLYGRLCEEMTNAEISQALQIPQHAVDNYLRAVRKRLADTLREQLHQHVSRYCEPEQVAEECAAEWEQLGNFLQQHGGLEGAVRSSFEKLEGHVRLTSAAAASKLAAMQQLTRHDDPSSSKE